MDQPLRTPYRWAALLGVAVLWIILAYVIVRGLPALNPAFFTQRPLPYGQVGGGVGPALVGSLILMGVAALIGVPIGVGAGIYLSEYGPGRFASAIRFCSDLIAGMPSIVIGVFVYGVVVLPMRQFSMLAGSVALGVMMIPIVARTTEELLRLVRLQIKDLLGVGGGDAVAGDDPILLARRVRNTVRFQDGETRRLARFDSHVGAGSHQALHRRRGGARPGGPGGARPGLPTPIVPSRCASRASRITTGGRRTDPLAAPTG